MIKNYFTIVLREVVEVFFFSSEKIQGLLNYPIWGRSIDTNGKFEGFPLNSALFG